MSKHKRKVRHASEVAAAERSGFTRGYMKGAKAMMVVMEGATDTKPNYANGGVVVGGGTLVGGGSASGHWEPPSAALKRS